MEERSEKSNSRIHWTKQRKIANIERMIDDVESGRVEIRGRDPKELVRSLRAKIRHIRR